MSNKPKLTGAKPLLTLTADNEFAKLEIHDNNAVKAFNLLYEMIRSDMTQATVAIVMAVDRLRLCDPEIYARYQQRFILAVDNLGKVN